MVGEEQRASALRGAARVRPLPRPRATPRSLQRPAPHCAPGLSAGKPGMLAAVSRLALVARMLVLVLGGVPLALTTACLPQGELAAADGSRRMVARDPQTGLSIVLTSGAWDGSPANLDSELTVLHALVANMGSTPVRLAPGDLELRDERGFRRQLLDAGGSFVLSGETDRGYHPGRDLDYGRLEWNGGDVNALALPWGVLAPGTQMRGYLYFRRLDHANAATLTWHFFSDKNQPLVDLAFDFFVARSR